MNWPNRLSLIRIALVPFIILMMYVNLPASYIIALALFALASFTDFLDGQIARRRHLVTNFGKFIDPVADKLLVLSTMIGLCAMMAFPTVSWLCWTVTGLIVVTTLYSGVEYFVQNWKCLWD